MSLKKKGKEKRIRNKIEKKKTNSKGTLRGITAYSEVVQFTRAEGNTNEQEQRKRMKAERGRSRGGHSRGGHSSGEGGH